MRTPRASSDPTVPYPQAGPARIGSPAVAGTNTYPHVPFASLAPHGLSARVDKGPRTHRSDRGP